MRFARTPARRTIGSLAALVATVVFAGCQERTVLQPASVVVTGGTVVTVDPDRRILTPGAVAIDGAAIVAIDTPEAIRSRYRPAEIIDATGQIVLPGLVNGHTHAPMVLYRGLADDLALMDWLEQYIFPAEARTVSPEFVRVGARLAVLEMIRSGTTTFADMYYFEEVIAEETRRAGLRGVLGQTIIGFPVADAGTPAEGLARAERFIEAFSGDELIVPAIAPHSMYTVDEATLLRCRALADRYAIPLLTHVSETENEVKGSLDLHGLPPVEYLESIGLLGPRTLAAHAVWVSEAETAILSRRGVALVHNPESNMKLASGTAPVPRYLAQGLTVSLGTDGAASNNDLDMFEAMRQAAFLHKLSSGDPRTLPAPVALEMATIHGARAIGMGDRIGSLEPGKRADLITVAVDGARTTPMYHAVSHLVYVSRGSDVRTTMVNGRILMREGRVLALDEPGVLADARRMAERVRAAVAGRQ